MSISDHHDDPAWLRQLASTYRGIRFGRGVVGKTTYAVISLIPVWLIIAWRANENIPLDIILLMIGIIPTLAVGWWCKSTQKFAEQNPAQAMLEGAELLEYKKFEATAKGNVNFLLDAGISDPEQHLTSEHHEQEN